MNYNCQNFAIAIKKKKQKKQKKKKKKNNKTKQSKPNLMPHSINCWTIFPYIVLYIPFKKLDVLPELWERNKDLLMIANFSFIIYIDLLRNKGFSSFPSGDSQSRCIVNQKAFR